MWVAGKFNADVATFMLGYMEVARGARVERMLTEMMHSDPGADVQAIANATYTEEDMRIGIDKLKEKLDEERDMEGGMDLDETWISRGMDSDEGEI